MSERKDGEWKPPIVKTVAVERKGIDELMVEIARHKDYISKCGAL